MIVPIEAFLWETRFEKKSVLQSSDPRDLAWAGTSRDDLSDKASKVRPPQLLYKAHEL